MRVMLADIEADALEAAVSELKVLGIEAGGVECDVALAASVQRAATATFAAFGRVHVLCSNAGAVSGGPIEIVSPGDWDWLIDANVKGFIHVIQAFLPHIKAHGEGGHIVTTASIAGIVSAAGIGPYSATKCAAVALTETLAFELAGTSISVSIFCPGATRTRVAESDRYRPKRYGKGTESFADAKTQKAAMASRMGHDPDDVASISTFAPRQAGTSLCSLDISPVTSPFAFSARRARPMTRAPVCS
jgi:NAD(P)-dependent dehydrogenase (short-subunit alcohol dehydrogenase family)